MKALETQNLKDVQNSSSILKIKIDKVGIKDLVHPIVVLDKKYGAQHTIANISLFVDLLKEQRGTHMSRFMEVLNCFDSRVFDKDVMDDFVIDIKNALYANDVYVELSFPFFLEKTAPISLQTSMLNYTCRMIQNYVDEKWENFTEVKVPITTLCPCSKEISENGAHNQRGIVTLLARHSSFIWIEDLIRLVEKEASCEIFPLLKRLDEKYVTEKAYANPTFVEDIVRKIAIKLITDDRISGFRLECENYESIHNHSAYANITVNL